MYNIWQKFIFQQVSVGLKLILDAPNINPSTYNVIYKAGFLKLKPVPCQAKKIKCIGS